MNALTYCWLHDDLLEVLDRSMTYTFDRNFIETRINANETRFKVMKYYRILLMYYAGILNFDVQVCLHGRIDTWSHDRCYILNVGEILHVTRQCILQLCWLSNMIIGRVAIHFISWRKPFIASVALSAIAAHRQTMTTYQKPIQVQWRIDYCHPKDRTANSSEFIKCKWLNIKTHIFYLIAYYT